MTHVFFGATISVLVVFALRRFLQIAAIGASYKAKVLCSALFVSKIDLDPNRSDEVSAEAYWPMRLFRATVDRAESTVRSSFFGACSRTAFYRRGYGASLGLRESCRARLPADELSPLDPTRPWPVGEGPPEEPSRPLSRVLDAAFSDPDRGRKRRTRAVVVVSDGRIVAERYAPGFSSTTPLNGWSMSKGVMGILIGTLVQDGVLSLDRRALLPEWTSPDDPRARISLEDLLRMRSGLRFSEVYSDPLSDVTRMLFDCPDAGAYAARRPLQHPPGVHWQYASGTTNILSLIARRALGDAAYAGWPRRALFDPVGMRSAVFETDSTGMFVGSSFLFATARDWARLGLLLERKGLWDGRTVVSPDWIERMTTPTPESPDGRYGAHWWLKLSKELGGDTPAARTLPPDAVHALGHEGQCLTVIPSRKLVVARLGLSIDITAWDHAAFLADLLAAI